VFETRLKVLLAVLAIALVVIVTRLIELQVLKAEHYRRRAEAVLLLEPKALPFVRGRIVDRFGKLLASDEPSWDVCVDYHILALDPQDEDVSPELRDEMDEMWADMVRFSGLTRAELDERVQNTVARVQQIRAAVAQRRGFDDPVREETTGHPVLTDLDDQEQVAARFLLGRYPWVAIEDSTRRIYHDAASLGHVLGRIGLVDADTIRDDPWADDPLARYLPDETAGLTGVEKAAEPILRGRRGLRRLNREGEVVEEIAPQAGRDVELTLRHDLQDRLYALLDRELRSRPQSSGGAIVVLDIATRELLALVSYPAYDPNRFQEDYPALLSDTRRLPLRFRAVANRYTPGSIVKPLTCLAGLATGRIGLHETILCTGYLYPDRPDMRPRCWLIHGTDQRKAHGEVDVVSGLEGSCNVFVARVGERVGGDDLTNFFDMFGLGRVSGTELPEETPGINPTPDWLASRNIPLTPGRVRNFSIGQDQVELTPVQAANMVAVYASGVYKPVTLIRGLRDPDPEWILPARPEHWQAIHEGLYRVVNSPSGTAYKYARWEEAGYVLCGKTGSATTTPWPVSYRIPYVDRDGREETAVVLAGSYGQAVDEFLRQHPDAAFDPKRVEVFERWPTGPPPEGGRHAHAWFVAYLQKVDAAGNPLWGRAPRVAFAVLVEFGGSGGRTSGPIACQVAHILVDTLGPDLDPDWLPVAEPDE
jgi:penicillin-binding protein 2